MKLPVEFILVIVLFLILIVWISVWASSSSYVPFYPVGPFLHQYPYEGYHNMGVHYSTYGENSSIDAYEKNDIVERPVKDAVKIRHFGLLSNPASPEKMIDILGDVKGSPDCTPNVFTNSTGYLCLDDNALKLLTTRGGNATGRSQQQVV